MLRRRFDALEMREHANPGRDHLGKLGAGNDGDDSECFLRFRRFDIFDARMGVRRAHKRDMHHARQNDVGNILAAALREPRQIGPRHRAADIGIRPIERGQAGRLVVGDFHFFSLSFRGRAKRGARNPYSLACGYGFRARGLVPAPRNDAHKNRVGHISVRHMWADGELSKPRPSLGCLKLRPMMSAKSLRSTLALGSNE